MRMTRYLGLALAACLSCFSIAALAAPLAAFDYVPRFMTAHSEPQGVAFKRLELTLAQWRAQTGSPAALISSNMRADSNGFIFNGLPSQHAVAEPALT